MRFYQIIVLVLGFCASNMETPPSARKRGLKLEFVGDNSEKENLRSKIQKIFAFLTDLHEPPLLLCNCYCLID